MPIVVRDPAAERAFVRRALEAYPKEHIEAIWGVRKGQNIYIHSFQELSCHVTRSEAEYASYSICEEDEVLDKYHDGLDEHAEDAKAEGVRVLGKIHSHPYTDSRKFGKYDDFPSEGDIAEDASEGSVIAGICLIRKHRNGRRYTSVTYWPLLKPFRKQDYAKFKRT